MGAAARQVNKAQISRMDNLILHAQQWTAPDRTNNTDADANADTCTDADTGRRRAAPLAAQSKRRYSKGGEQCKVESGHHSRSHGGLCPTPRGPRATPHPNYRKKNLPKKYLKLHHQSTAVYMYMNT